MNLEGKHILIIGVLLLLALAGGGKDDVTPTPPEPTPDSAPFDCDGLHVLIVEETEQRGSLPPGQLSVLQSPQLREWFDEHDVEWRIYDQHTDVAGAGKPWPEAMRLPRDSLPWIALSDGSRGHTGPLPEGVDGVTALVSQYE